MAEKITLDEAKRRRAEKEAATRQSQPGADVPPLRNGHDHKPREIEVADWNSLSRPQAHDNLVGGLVGNDQLVMVYGESGSGKSFITFDMVAHYALGREWMGHKVKGGGVLYIAAEGSGGWANRVEAFCRHHNLDEEARAMIPFGFVLENVNLGRTGNGDVAAVMRAAERWAKRINASIDIIVVDTMARATPGANENDAADMGAFVANMDAIRRQTKATPITVHHSGKNQTLGARGHSSLRAAMDAELEVERTDAGRVIRTRKSRDGFDNAEQAFNLEVVEVGTDEEGQPITSCVVVPADIGTVGKRRKTTKRQRWQLALDVLDNALVDFPEPSPGGRLPNVNMTTVAHFRQALERASIINTEATKNTQTQQWVRSIKSALQERGHLRIEGDLCWRPDMVKGGDSDT
jgi:RecA/RadA recombinase